MKTVGVLLVLAILWGITAGRCAAQGAMPAIFVEEVENPPTVWETIYHEVEDCVGLKGKYKAVQWYVTTAPWESGTGLVYGLWSGGKGRARIIIAAYDTAVVRHEVLHDILHRNGFKPFRLPADNSTNPEHPQPPFGTCAKRYFP